MDGVEFRFGVMVGFLACVLVRAPGSFRDGSRRSGPAVPALRIRIGRLDSRMRFHGRARRPAPGPYCGVTATAQEAPTADSTLPTRCRGARLESASMSDDAIPMARPSPFLADCLEGRDPRRTRGSCGTAADRARGAVRAVDGRRGARGPDASRATTRTETMLYGRVSSRGTNGGSSADSRCRSALDTTRAAGVAQAGRVHPDSSGISQHRDG